MMELPPAWRYANPTHIVFGAGALAQLPDVVPWPSLLLVTTPGADRRGTIGRIQASLRDRAIRIYSAVAPEPQLSSLEEAAGQLSGATYQAIIAVGGGSAIDTAKALAYLLRAPTGALRRHLAQGTALPTARALPVLAIPTTAGTGAEVTPFATIWDAPGQKKHSMEAPDLLPHTALLDPVLTLTAPRDLTLSTGLDTLCHGLESLWSRATNPVATSFALRAVAVCLTVLPSLLDDLDDVALRVRMMEASLLAGLAIASTRTTLSHSISYPLTLRFHVPHGLACAFSIAQVARFNAETHRSRLQGIATALGFPSSGDLADTLEELLAATGALRWLATLIPSRHDLLTLAPEAFTPGRANNNPRPATEDDVRAILARAWSKLLPEDHAPLGRQRR